MAYVRPFKGIHYNPDIVNISRVVSPPYDVISPKLQHSLYRLSKYNIVRIILGKPKKGDNSRNNRYTRAKLFFDSWFKKGILVEDKEPSLYVYSQHYCHKGRCITRVGFIGIMKLEDPRNSKILPHEYTLDSPKKDRMALIKETGANLSPIFSLFEDRKNKIMEIVSSYITSKKALFSLDFDDIRHKMWRIADRSITSSITRLMKDKKIFIADGHHRYEVSLSYRDMMKKTARFKSSMDYVMMYFTNLSEHDKLTILSTHRVIKNIPNFKEELLKQKLGVYFNIESISDIEDMFRRLEDLSKDVHIFGVYTKNKRFYILSLKDSLCVDEPVDCMGSSSLKKLDVTILHELIINKILGLKKYTHNIKYIREEKDALRLVDSKRFQVAFFLRPTDVMDMKSIAEKGEMMPHKSTYFYPKLLTGLVMYSF